MNQYGGERKVTPTSAAAVGAGETHLRNWFVLLVFSWTILIVVLAYWDYRQAYSYSWETAKAGARNSYDKDLVYRRWASLHGGVYVPVTSETPPNPYLAHIPERDIVTPSGTKLTLMNPAYMTREVQEMGEKQYGLRGHITSLKPIRPENGPDEWERGALLAFERGEKEVLSLERLGNEPYLRVMRPLMTDVGCLKCHKEQGYKAGDVRGGISVSVPWKPYEDALAADSCNDRIRYAGIWALGLLGLWFSWNRIQTHLSNRKRAEEALRKSEQRRRLAQEAANSGTWEWDLVTNAIIWSEELWTLYELEPNSREPSYEAWLQSVHPDDRTKVDRVVREAASTGAELNAEWRVVHRDGEDRWLMSRGNHFEMRAAR
jgi:PAS domain-containing protein